MEGDLLVQHPSISDRCHFNPLPPHGGRQRCVILWNTHRNFNPLPPHGGRPMCTLVLHILLNFNPLPPHGGRLHTTTEPQHLFYFNPLPPHGGRQSGVSYSAYQKYISIHSLRMEGDDGCVLS